MIKLGTPITDVSTGQKGMLTLYQLEENKSAYYYFQAKALSPKTGEPVPGRWVTEAVIEGGTIVEDPKIPEGLLGSFATDSASGFCGRITSLRLHINGCLHVSLQSNKILADTGTVPDSLDFDLRRLVGYKVPVFDEKGLEEDRKKNPSPEAVKPYRPRH